MRPARTRWLAALITAGALLVSGCSGVPRSSRPEIVRPVDAGDNTVTKRPDVAPSPGDDPRAIVTGFLRAAVNADVGHTQAKLFLTTDAKRKWQDNAATVVDDYRVDVPHVNGGTATVVVTGRRVGQLDNRGVYSPITTGAGYADKEQFTYTLTKIGNDWRINDPPQGLLVKRLDFDTYFRARSLYFFDASETQLVPDLRYSQLDGQALSSWLLTQTVAGPREELASSVVNEVSDQINLSRTNVTFGDRTQIELPGALQIDKTGQLRLAAQLAWTFGSVQFDISLRITDGGSSMSLPNIGSEFRSSDFDSVGPKGSLSAAAASFYIRGGALINGMDGRPVAGRLGTAAANLDSVAALRQSNSDVRLAAVSAGRLKVGSILRGVRDVRVGATIRSRPEWNPGSGDAWVGTDLGLFRVGSDLRARKVSIASSRGGQQPPGAVIAVRFSPDGARVGLVMQEPDNHSTLWVGSVVPSGAEPHIDSLEQITPDALGVTDVAWSSGTTLFAVARTLDANASPGVWSVQSDGSTLVSQPVEDLPAGPQSIAAAPGQFVIVAVNNTLWVQRSSTWSSLDGSPSTAGHSPVYAQ
jgi:hypothetical protein